MVPRSGPQPSLISVYYRWRYERARACVRARYREWAKLDYPGYSTFALLKAEQRAHYWKKKLQEAQS